MKIARYILRALAGIFTILIAVFGMTNNPDDKKRAIYCAIVAISAWAVEVFLLVRSQHRKTQLDLSVTPKGKLEPAIQPKPVAVSPLPPGHVIEPIKPPPQYAPWTEYAEDVFDKIIWRWRYNAHIDQTPRNLHWYCIECQKLMRKTQPFHASRGYSVQLTCNRHSFYHVKTNSQGDFTDIKERIKKKLEDGSWVEVVNKQRVTKGQSPISLPTQKTDIQVPDEILDEIPAQILRVLARKGGECGKYEFEEALNFLCFQEQKKAYNPVEIDYHLDDLEKQKKYILIAEYVYPPFRKFTLTQPGRKYVLDHKLDWMSDDAKIPRRITLDSISERILMIVAEHGGSCWYHDFVEWFEAFSQDPPHVSVLDGLLRKLKQPESPERASSSLPSRPLMSLYMN